TGNVSARCVDDSIEIYKWEKCLDELLSKLTLHERVGGNHADETRRFREQKEAFRERRSERVLARGRPRIDFAVSFAKKGVFHCDVWWVTDDGGVLFHQDRLRRLFVFKCEGLSSPYALRLPFDVSKMTLLTRVQKRVGDREL